MAESMAAAGAPPVTNGTTTAPRRPTAAPAPTGSPSGIRGPRMIMQERFAREARQRAEAEQLQMERARAEQEARLLEEVQRREADRHAAGVAATEANARDQTQEIDLAQQGQPNTLQGQRIFTYSQSQSQQTQQLPSQAQPQTQPQAQPTQRRTTRSTADPQAGYTAAGTTQAPPQQPQMEQPTSGLENPTGKPRNSFPHAFERWETLSAHWEGLTSFWIRKLEQNKTEVNRDPLSQQLARQVTDLSAAGANLFHAVVELQRLRASSERKFQRWFFETRSELERAREVNAMLEQALEKERQNRADAIRNAVENEQGSSKVQKQLAEMRKELSISKEEARRAWEELGRREQEERDRTLALQTGQPTIVGGVQVVPMAQGSGRYGNREPQPEYGQGYHQSEQPQAPASQPESARTYQQSHRAGASDGGYSEGEFVTDLQGNPLLDLHGNRIPFAAPPSTYTGSDMEAEDYDTPASTNPPTGGHPTPSTSAGGVMQTPSQDYTGAGYGAPGWEDVPRHHHPTRLSDVIEEDDERSRTSASQSRS